MLEGYHVKGKKFVVFLVLGFVGLFAYTFFYTLLALIFVASVVLSMEKK